MTKTLTSKKPKSAAAVTGNFDHSVVHFILTGKRSDDLNLIRMSLDKINDLYPALIINWVAGEPQLESVASVSTLPGAAPVELYALHGWFGNLDRVVVEPVSYRAEETRDNIFQLPKFQQAYGTVLLKLTMAVAPDELDDIAWIPTPLRLRMSVVLERAMYVLDQLNPRFFGTLNQIFIRWAEDKSFGESSIESLALLAVTSHLYEVR